MGSLLQAGQQYALLSGAEDAVYVNQKQFHRILKRRQARMKLEAKFKIMPRKVLLSSRPPPFSSLPCRSRPLISFSALAGVAARLQAQARQEQAAWAWGTLPQQSGARQAREYRLLSLLLLRASRVLTNVCVSFVHEVDDDYDGEGYGDEGGSSSPPNPTSPAPSNFVG
jgi:hypothetical protein